MRDQAQSVLEREDASDAGGDVFTDAVAHHDGRLDTPRPPELREGILDRKERWLREGRVVQQIARRFILHHHRYERTFQDRIEDRRAIVKRLRKTCCDS